MKWRLPYFGKRRGNIHGTLDAGGPSATPGVRMTEKFGTFSRGESYAFRAHARGRILVHAGLHKTGSTSLQSSLRSSGLLLSAARADFRSQDLLASRLKQARARGLVVSSEHFLGEMVDFYSSAAERLAWLCQEFGSVTVIVYLRPHLEWHESAFSQLIQQGTPMTEGEYIRVVEQSPVADFRELARQITRVNKSASIGLVRWAPDVVGDFSHVIGFNLPQTHIRNSSLHPLALEAMRRMTQTSDFGHNRMRRILGGWAPETACVTSIFSEQTQSYFIRKHSEWLETAEILSSFQEVPPGWYKAFKVETRPSARDMFSDEHLSSVLAALRTSSSSVRD